MTTVFLYLTDSLGSLIVHLTLLDGFQRIVINDRLRSTVFDDKVFSQVLEVQHQAQGRAQQHGSALVIHLIGGLSPFIIDGNDEIAVRTRYLFLKSLCRQTCQQQASK